MSDQLSVQSLAWFESKMKGLADEVAAKVVEKLRAQGVASKPTAPRPSGSVPTNLPNYGKQKGQPIASADMQTLEYYLNNARRDLADPSKGQFHEKERAMIAALEAEIAKRNGSAAPSDEDVAF